MLVGAVVLVGTAAVSAPAQQPELAISVTADRPAVSYPGRHEIAFTVKLRTGPRAVEYMLSLAPSRFTTRRAGIRTQEGATMRTVRRPPHQFGFVLAGQASLLYPNTLRGQPACSPVQNRFHGIGEAAVMAALSMPAHAEATLTAYYETGVVPPWPGDEHAVTVTARPLPTSASTLTRSTAPVRSPAVALRGTTGTRITLATTPRSALAGVKEQRSARLGRVVRVRGTTDPPLRSGRITLRHVPPGARKPTLLARVRTDRRGRFTYRWTPKRGGLHELWAYSPAGPRRVADHTCPVAIRMTRRG